MPAAKESIAANEMTADEEMNVLELSSILCQTARAKYPQHGAGCSQRKVSVEKKRKYANQSRWEPRAQLWR